MSAEVVPVSSPVTHAGITVTSSSETEEQIRAAIGAPTVDEETSEAASKLGKKGGQAAAEARKAKPADDKKPEAKEKPAVEAEPEPEKAAKEPEAKPEAKEKKPGRVEQLQGQIARLAAERRTEEERLAKVRQEREQLERPREQPKAKPVDEDPSPDENDAEKYPDGRLDAKYLEDKIAHGIRKGLKGERERIARETEANEKQRVHTERANSFRDRMESALDDDDFKTRLQALPDDPVKGKIVVDLLGATPYDLVPEGEARGPLNLIAHWLLTSPVAPQVTLYLAEHPEDFQKLTSESPDGLMRSLARLEAKLEQPQERPAAATAGTARAPEFSQAKPALRPVRATASAAEKASLEELSEPMSLDDYARKSGRKVSLPRR